MTIKCGYSCGLACVAFLGSFGLLWSLEKSPTQSKLQQAHTALNSRLIRSTKQRKCGQKRRHDDDFLCFFVAFQAEHTEDTLNSVCFWSLILLLFFFFSFVFASFLCFNANFHFLDGTKKDVGGRGGWLGVFFAFPYPHRSDRRTSLSKISRFALSYHRKTIEPIRLSLIRARNQFVVTFTLIYSEMGASRKSFCGFLETLRLKVTKKKHFERISEKGGNCQSGPKAKKNFWTKIS